MVDSHLKWIAAFPTSNEESNTVAKCLLHIVAQIGVQLGVTFQVEDKERTVRQVKIFLWTVSPGKFWTCGRLIWRSEK